MNGKACMDFIRHIFVTNIIRKNLVLRALSLSTVFGWNKTLIGLIVPEGYKQLVHNHRRPAEPIKRPKFGLIPS